MHVVSLVRHSHHDGCNNQTDNQECHSCHMVNCLLETDMVSDGLTKQAVSQRKLVHYLQNCQPRHLCRQRLIPAFASSQVMSVMKMLVSCSRELCLHEFDNERRDCECRYNEGTVLLSRRHTRYNVMHAGQYSGTRTCVSFQHRIFIHNK
jgi:hypothetical protein